MSSAFFQQAPDPGHPFRDDLVLQDFLAYALPTDLHQQLLPSLDTLGQRVREEVQPLGEQAEAQPPRHIPYDAWGRRIDRIEVSDAWRALERIAAEEGLVATGYLRHEAEHARLHQAARLYLYAPASAIFTCPLAMTDGAARAIELYGDEYLRNHAYVRLTSRDPAQFWTSGQWMTERTGGSDVSGTSTVAKWEGDKFRLYGTKWFTSATTSQMAMTLARIEGHPAGSRGLSMFYLELRDTSGKLNQLTVHRLKDKLGTKALPTAELTLEGTPARLVGGEGHGVRKIASLFNITRIYNSICAVSMMRRGLALARDYAHKREAFGRPLSQQPLHVETLAALQLDFEACFHLTFEVVKLLGREELGKASPEESAILRLLTPITKLFTAREGVKVASEVLEAFGGAGYVEDTGLPRLLRDAQVLAIWEGTTNVLSLDTLRALEKEAALAPWQAWLGQLLAGAHGSPLESEATRITAGVHEVSAWLAQARDAEQVQLGARALALSMARLTCAGLLVRHALWHRREQPVHGPDLRQPLARVMTAARAEKVARRWCHQPLVSLIDANAQQLRDSQLLGTETLI